jgi:hypothetical protein
MLVSAVVSQSYLVETVPFSDDNREWIRQEIQKAVNPNGFKKIANWLRYWSLLAICITAFVGLIAITVSVWNSANSRLSQESEFRGKTEQRLTNIEQRTDKVEQRLSDIDTNILALRTQLSAANPTDKHNQAEAAEVLQHARDNSIQLPLEVVKDAGQRFIQVGANQPMAWEIGLQFLNYRSFLNVAIIPQPAPVSPVSDEEYQYILNTVLPPQSVSVITISKSGTAKPEDSALMDSLVKPSPPGSGSGAQFLIVETQPGVGISLDNMRMKNVIIMNANILYSGKPVQLINVAFLNCTFKIERNPTSTRFGDAVLTQDRLDFRDSSTGL